MNSFICKNKMRITYKFYLASIFIGIIGGFVCVAFRYLIYQSDNLRTSLFRTNGFSDFQRIINNGITMHETFIVLGKYIALLLITILFLNIIFRMVRMFPTTSGSGLPQTKALLERKMEYKSPFKNIIVKFLGGILSITSGLSFGREGSSVQMGSLIGYIFGKSFKVEEENKNYLIAAGAGAGISAAFTAPLASSILILESLKNDNTDDIKKLTISTLLSGLFAGIIAILFFPSNIYSSILIIKPELEEYQMLMIYISMAFIFSILGKLFSNSFIFIKKHYERFQNKYDRHYLWLALLIIAITFFYPSLVGGNQTFTIEIIENDSYSLFSNLLILMTLAILTIISNATGFPGGLFIPLLSMGGLLGKIFCITLADFDIISLSNTGYFVLIGMSVFFISVVRTPLTGFILISEMTGNYDVLFPTLVVGILTYIFTEILNVRPLDNILYDLMMQNRINTGSSCS
ncbi:MAG: chloride channel protein [Bacteroidales bacterium]|nr:chloride channel protein [Bacteroidales bacterium]